MSDRPNIVVIVLDSLRADRTSLADGERDTTPHLRRLADESRGRSFPTAIAHTRYTLPSSASMLTGQYPGDHGVGFGSNAIAESVPTVAESFRDAGYGTALVSNNHFVSPETGLDRGFETTTVLPKDPLGILRTVGLRTATTYLANISRHSAGIEFDKYRHSSAFLTTALARQTLDTYEKQSEPFFMYVHYNQTHRPYYPPLAWFDRYDDAIELPRSEAGDFAMDVHENLVEKVAEGCPFTDAEWATLRALYDAQVEYTDSLVGDLVDEIRSRFDDTIVVITSDHGEHLGERGALGHKYVLDDALLRVPLVTTGLDAPATTSPVQHSDVMRTLLAIADADDSFVDGIDLRTETRDFAVSQDGARSLEPIYEFNPEFDAAQFYPPADDSIPCRTAIRTETHRYVQGNDGSCTLYRLPNETVDVSETESDVVATLDEKTATWLQDHRPVDPERNSARDDELSAAAKSRLEKMGYLESEL